MSSGSSAFGRAAAPGRGSGRCPCGTGESYAVCCGPLHASERDAVTAEELMRSRYSAFAMRDADYLQRTWHPRTRPQRIDLDAAEWLGLTVVRCVEGGPDDAEGLVEFVARWALGSRRGEQHEVSHFARRAGRWCYVDGGRP